MKLEASGLKLEQPLHLRKASYYIEMFLDTWMKKFGNFHVKNLCIRGSKDDISISDETFATICNNLISKRLKSLHLYNIDLSKDEDAKEASAKMVILRDCIKKVKDNYKTPLELRLNDCCLNGDFSFINFSKQGELSEVQIKNLSLVGCNITDGNLEGLIESTAKLPSIKIMNLQGNKVSLEGANKLIESDAEYQSSIKIYLHSNRGPNGALIDKEQFNEIIKDLKDRNLSISV